MTRNLPVFSYDPPTAELIGVVSIPHSGEIIPDEFRRYLVKDPKALGQDVDTAVDQLIDIDSLNAAGIGVLRANVHRVCVDLNRPEQESVLNWRENSHGIRLVVDRPDTDQESHLLGTYYKPYYQMIDSLIDEMRRVSTSFSFIDLHSMPSQPTEYHLRKNPNQEQQRPDFCLSDLEGRSCADEFIRFVADKLSQSFEKVYCNNPYFGGQITRHVNAEFNGGNALQIEVKRNLYLSEKQRKIEPKKVEFVKLKLTQILKHTFQSFGQSHEM